MKLSPLARLRPYRGSLVLGLFCLLLTNGLGQGIPWVVKLTIEAVEQRAESERLWELCGLIVLLAIGQGLLRVGSRVYIFNIGRKVEYGIRNELFAKLLALQPSFYRRHGTGDLMSRLTNDIGSVRALFGPGILYVANTVFAYAIAIPLMGKIHPTLMLLALIPYPIIFYAGGRLMKRVYGHSVEVQQSLGRLSDSLQEDLTGVGVVKAYALEERRGVHFAARCERYLERSMALAKARALMGLMMGVVGGVGVFIALIGGGVLVIDGKISIGDLVAFNIYVGILMWPTLAIGWIMSLWQRGLAAWQRLAEILSEQPTIADAAGVVASHLPSSHARDERIAGPIELKGLTVEIDGQKILDDLHLTIPKGTTLGLVGRVGAGKSMLAELLPRMLEIEPGTLFFGGADATRIPLARLRASIGYAPQEAFLFSRSIRDNIALGGGSEERIPAAAEAAGLGPDLRGLSAGLDTLVGERGVTLSGGQRQRAALARALSGDAPILVLDDSLSSVDAETEARVLAQLRHELSGRTAIVVSHRLTALRHLDRIVVIDRGRIVEQGTHEELLARGRVYADLYKRQVLAEELRELEPA